MKFSLESLADSFIREFESYERCNDEEYRHKGIDEKGWQNDKLKNRIGESKYFQDDDFENQNSDDYLGVFIPFHSPAVIELNGNNLFMFYKYLIAQDVFCESSSYKAYGIVSAKNLKALAWITILKTYLHECVHYLIAIENYRNRSMFSLTKLEEEALAVSFSYHIIENYSKYSTSLTASRKYNQASFTQNVILGRNIVQINAIEDLIPSFLGLAYQYVQPGYRDFIRVNELCELINGYMIARNSELSKLARFDVKIDQIIEQEYSQLIQLSKEILVIR